MSANHSDTGEFPVFVPPVPAATAGRTPWSTVRCVLSGLAAFMGIAFVFDVVMQPGHDAGRLPAIILDLLRASWVIALAAALIAWAYDAVKPKVYQRYRKVIAAIRLVSQCQTIMNVTLAEQGAAIGGIAEALNRLTAQQVELAAELGKKIDDTYTYGYNRGWERGVKAAQAAPKDDAVIPFPQRRGTL